MQTIADALAREHLIGLHVSCVGCGAVEQASRAYGWKALLAWDFAPAVFCPKCLVPELRRFVAERRAARSMTPASSRN